MTHPLHTPVTVAVPALIERHRSRRFRRARLDIRRRMWMGEVAAPQQTLEDAAHRGAIEHLAQLRHCGVKIVAQAALWLALQGGAIDVLVKALAELVHAEHQEAVDDEPLHVGVGEELDLAVTHALASPSPNLPGVASTAGATSVARCGL